MRKGLDTMTEKTSRVSGAEAVRDAGPVGAPVVLGNEPGSFAWGVLAKRHPALIRQVRDAFPYGRRQHEALDALLDEITNGVVEPLALEDHDFERWADWGRGYFGRSWYDAPFLWAESYFYRRLLGAVGYFGTGPWRGTIRARSCWMSPSRRLWAGLPRRCRHAAGRARRVRLGGIGPDCLPAHRRPCRSRTEGADRDPVGAGRSTLAGLGTGRDEKSGRRRLGDRGHRRRARPCALREAGRRRDLEEDLRPSPARRVRRPRPGRIRRAGCRAAAARQRGLQHRERSHRNRSTRSGPTPQAPAAGPEDATHSLPL